MKSKMLLSKLFFVISLLTFINCSESDKVVENDSDSEGMCTGKGPENCGGEKDEKHGEIKTSSKIVGDEDKNHSDEEMEAELKEEQTEEQEYRKGSACSYCSYCKFCKLCDKDCPCETSHKKPNCDMCKYCKYCYLCKGCSTICQPGGVIDRFTSYVSNHLPKFNKEQVDEDIEKVKDYIEDYKEEL